MERFWIAKLASFTCARAIHSCHQLLEREYTLMNPRLQGCIVILYAIQQL